MNIITTAEVEKFITLLKAGLKNGEKKCMRIYDSAQTYDNTNVKKNYYVNLEFNFYIDAQIIDELFLNEDAGLTEKIKDMLK